jgi:hypothetical protein
MEASQQGDPQDSQQEPTQDSGLQTPQPDQPVPSEEERQAQTAEVGPSGQPAEGTVSPLSNEEQEAAEAQRQQELEAARREHNERTGGGPVNEGELQAQRDEHNARTGDASRPADPAEQPAPESDEG